MDRHNLAMLETLRPRGFRGHLGLLLALSDESKVLEIPDPYYGGPREFQYVLDLVEKGAATLLEAVQIYLAIGDKSNLRNTTVELGRGPSRGR